MTLINKKIAFISLLVTVLVCRMCNVFAGNEGTDAGGGHWQSRQNPLYMGQNQSITRDFLQLPQDTHFEPSDWMQVKTSHTYSLIVDLELKPVVKLTKAKPVDQSTILIEKSVKAVSIQPFASYLQTMNQKVIGIKINF